FCEQAIKQLKAEFKNLNIWQQRSLYFGGVNAVQHGQTNVAIGDSRRMGVGLVQNINPHIS
ncbi:hypothetical protein MNBD_GAMMA01-1165, partial [hydrothermal vent metagenome]